MPCPKQLIIVGLRVPSVPLLGQRRDAEGIDRRRRRSRVEGGRRTRAARATRRLRTFGRGCGARMRPLLGRRRCLRWWLWGRVQRRRHDLGRARGSERENETTRRPSGGCDGDVSGVRLDVAGGPVGGLARPFYDVGHAWGDRLGSCGRHCGSLGQGADRTTFRGGRRCRSAAGGATAVPSRGADGLSFAPVERARELTSLVEYREREIIDMEELKRATRAAWSVEEEAHQEASRRSVTGAEGS